MKNRVWFAIVSLPVVFGLWIVATTMGGIAVQPPESTAARSEGQAVVASVPVARPASSPVVESARDEHVADAPPNPFFRLTPLAPEDISKLRQSRDCAVANCEAALANLPSSEPERKYALNEVTEQLERHKAIRSELQRERAYQDDFSFGTTEKQWFEQRRSEMVRIHDHGIWAIVLLDDSEYPGLATARTTNRNAVDELTRRRSDFRKATKQRRSRNN